MSCVDFKTNLLHFNWLSFLVLLFKTARHLVSWNVAQMLTNPPLNIHPFNKHDEHWMDVYLVKNRLMYTIKDRLQWNCVPLQTLSNLTKAPTCLSVRVEEKLKDCTPPHKVLLILLLLQSYSWEAEGEGVTRSTSPHVGAIKKLNPLLISQPNLSMHVIVPKSIPIFSWTRKSVTYCRLQSEGATWMGRDDRSYMAPVKEGQLTCSDTTQTLIYII